MGRCSTRPSNHEDQELEDVCTKEGAMDGVAMFSFSINTHEIQTDIVNPEGSESCSGGIHVQRSNHQCCITLYNSEAPVRSAVNRNDSAAQ
jgi:hypothetical protein